MFSFVKYFNIGISGNCELKNVPGCAVAGDGGMWFFEEKYSYLFHLTNNNCKLDGEQLSGFIATNNRSFASIFILKCSESPLDSVDDWQFHADLHSFMSHLAGLFFFSC